MQMRTLPIAGGLIAAATLAAGCGDAVGGPVSAPPRTAPVAYEQHGVPGPWWRPRASPSDFERDMRTCRSESAEARERSTPEARKDAAYRTFLDCMKRLAWRRGHPVSAGAQG